MTSQDKERIIEALQEANKLVYQATDSLKQARRLISNNRDDFSYNIAGAMDSYVINYLTDGIDCITEKIDKYIEEVEEIDVPEDEEDKS